MGDIDDAHGNGDALRLARQKEMDAEIVLACSIPTHQNLVRIFGYIREPFGVVMNFMGGGSVQEFAYRKLRMARTEIPSPIPSVAEVLIILKKAAAGLKFLHSFGLVHRDIACRNILLGQLSRGRVIDGTEVRISDFGLTRLIEEHKENGNGNAFATQKTVSSFGPLKWMAPESIKRKAYSKRSDVFMFGITMWELFHGMEPYPKRKNHIQLAMDVVTKHARPTHFDADEFDGRRDMPDGYEQLMRQCWAHSPKQRPTFAKIVDSLACIQANPVTRMP